MKIKDNKQSSYLLFMFAILFTLTYTLIRFRTTYPSIPWFNSDGNGLFFYYSFMNAGDNVIWYAIMFFIAGQITGSYVLINRKSGFDKLVKTRSGIWPYYRSLILHNLIWSGFIFLVCEVCCLFTVNTFLDRITLNSVLTDYAQFHRLASDSAINLLLSMILSAIGFQIYSLLVFSLSFWIKNLNLYRASGIILGMILLFVPIIGVAFPQDSLIERGLSFFYLPNILSAGISSYGRYPLPYSPWIMFAGTGAVYLLSAFTLISGGIRNEKISG